jgi:hypothetical protein
MQSRAYVKTGQQLLFSTGLLWACVSPPVLLEAQVGVGVQLEGSYTAVKNFRGVDLANHQIFALTYGSSDADENSRLRVFEGMAPPVQVAETLRKGACKVQVVGDYVFVLYRYFSTTVSIWGTGLDVFRRTTLEERAWAGYEGEGQSLYVANNVAYLGIKSLGLYLYDVSRLDTCPASCNLGKDYLLARYTDAKWCYDVCVAGSHAFIADGSNGLLILDVSQPRSPVLVTKWSSTDRRSVKAVFHEGNLIYLAGERFFILDVSNPALPRLVGELSLWMSGPDGDTRVKVSNGFAYVAGEGGLAVLNVQDPAQPRHVGSFSTPYRAEDIKVNWPLIYLADRSGLYVLRHGESYPFEISATEGQVEEVVTLTATKGSFPTDKSNVKVVFLRDIPNQGTVEAEAEVIEATASLLRVRVPIGILGNRSGIAQLPQNHGRESIRVRSSFTASGHSQSAEGQFTLILPWNLIYDMVVNPSPEAPRRQILPQYILANSNSVQTFLFEGKSSDALVALRVLNTTVLGIRPDGTKPLVPPLILNGEVDVFPPHSAAPLLPGSLPNIGMNNAGLSLLVNGDGLYLVVVRAHVDSEFPGPFQIHLAGNVGLPMKQNEAPRATRQDILLNQAAPRPQALRTPPNLTNLFQSGAEAALFKFANSSEVNPFAVALIIPPTAPGAPIIRAMDPTNFLGITVPTASTPEMTNPPPGTLLDFTQVPIPALANLTSTPSLNGLPAAALGMNDGLSATQSLILDWGSGSELVDGPGADLEVFATGTYQVSAGNTPYTTTYVALGTGLGIQSFDLSGSGLNVARYILVAGTNITIDAIQGRHVFADRFLNDVGPMTDVGQATILMQRKKESTNTLDPFLELIGTDGTRLGDDDSGFGDLTSLNYTDAALVNLEVGTTGFYRFLARGYPQMPEYDIMGFHEFVGGFFVRLETGGDYSTELVVISPADESAVAPQRTGRINRLRQRDSYLVSGLPGQRLNIAVQGAGENPLPDPIVELYDPEGFLLAANDDYPGRGKNSAITAQLPGVTGDATRLPLDAPQTYRIVVSGVDRPGGKAWILPRWPNCVAFPREIDGGDYDLRVFRGALVSTGTGPWIQSISPASACPGSTVTIRGANFSSLPTENKVQFGNTLAVVTAANATLLVATVPPGLIPGPMTVTVTVNGLPSNMVTVQVRPIIHSCGLVGVTGSVFWLAVETKTNLLYWLERSDSLKTWSVVQNPVPGNGGILVVTNSRPIQNSQLFFRIGVKQP